MSILLAASKPGNVATFRIRNDKAERIAVKVSVMTRSVSPEGAEENQAAGGLFAVYPMRVLVEPGASATVKVQWQGGAEVQAERPFRVVAEQVPINAGEAGSGIRILFRYVASLYVGRPDYVPSLEVTASGATGEKGEKGFLVEIRNVGTRHVVALGARLGLKDPEGKAIGISSEELGALNGANYLPGQPRRLFIPSEEATPGMLYTASVDYAGEY